MTDPFERSDMTFEFPEGVKPFRAGDWFQTCTDVRPGAQMTDRVEVYRCELGRNSDHIVFIRLPRLSS